MSSVSYHRRLLSIVAMSVVGAGLLFAAMSPAMSADRELKEVKLYDIEKKETLVEAYPFLKSAIDDIIENEKAMGNGAQTVVQASKLNYPALKKTVLLVRYNSTIECGTEGCTTDVYVDQGKGYAPAFNGTTQDPVYISTCGSDLSLVFGTARGFTEWKLKDKGFAADKTYQDLKQLPTCK